MVGAIVVGIGMLVAACGSSETAAIDAGRVSVAPGVVACLERAGATRATEQALIDRAVDADRRGELDRSAGAMARGVEVSQYLPAGIGDHELPYAIWVIGAVGRDHDPSGRLTAERVAGATVMHIQRPEASTIVRAERCLVRFGG